MKTFAINFIAALPIVIFAVCSYGDYMFPLNMILGFSAGAISVIALIVALITKKKRLTAVSSAIALSVFIAFGVLKYQDDQRIINAEKLIAALDSYRADHKRYPAKLEELSPEYLKNLPRNWFEFPARQYGYAADQDSYTLKIKSGKNTGMVWISTKRAWDYFD